MMPDMIPSGGRHRPFPWLCTKCKEQEVYPQETDYTANVKHDRCSYAIHIPDLPIPTCRNCGEQTFTPGIDDRIVTALRARAGLLSPQEITNRRGQLNLGQEELADQLGVAKETICRWETGAIIQSLAMDNVLRLYFESEEVRCFLRRRFTLRRQPLSEPLGNETGTQLCPLSSSIE